MRTLITEEQIREMNEMIQELNSLQDYIDFLNQNMRRSLQIPGVLLYTRDSERSRNIDIARRQQEMYIRSLMSSNYSYEVRDRRIHNIAIEDSPSDKKLELLNRISRKMCEGQYG